MCLMYLETECCQPQIFIVGQLQLWAISILISGRRIHHLLNQLCKMSRKVDIGIIICILLEEFLRDLNNTSC